MSLNFYEFLGCERKDVSRPHGDNHFSIHMTTACPLQSGVWDVVHSTRNTQDIHNEEIP